MTVVDPCQTRGAASTAGPRAAKQPVDRDALEAAFKAPSGGLVMAVAEGTAPPSWVEQARAAADAGGLALLLTAHTAWTLDCAEVLEQAAVARWPALAACRDGLRLVLQEAIVNAAAHGSLRIPPGLRDGPHGWDAHAQAVQGALHDPDRAGQPVMVTLTADSDGSGGCTARVRDAGPGFDPPTRSEPGVMPGPGRMGGRGLALIRRICDRVSWSDDGRLVTMTLVPPP